MATAIPKDHDRSLELERVEARSDRRFVAIELEAAAS
jgi:hypothetical protein